MRAFLKYRKCETLRSLIEDVTRTCATGHSMEHGIGIHDQIVVLVLIEEGVGHEDPQPFEPIPTLNVSSNDPQVTGQPQFLDD